MRPFSLDLPALDRCVVGRSSSFFADDLTRSLDELSDLILGRRILVIGGAGSIGFNTLQTILQFEPASIHVIDHDENGLAELVRGLRSNARTPPLGDLQTLPFDYGGDPFRLWLSASPLDYDYVLNFAALKHVRSEKDPFSILAMLETNVLHLERLSRLLARRTPPRRVFSVSTDKAANPSSMMGATKRLMEHALFLPTQPWPTATAITSARFANVAFSHGSLLHGWQLRLAARQPLACPENCRRFFVSLDESGHLCTLAGFLGTDRTLTIPALQPSEHLVLLSDVATRFLEHHGFEAHFTREPDEALGRAEELIGAGRWPVLLTPLDTGGEKPFEEFVGENESVRHSDFDSLLELEYLPPADTSSFPAMVGMVRDMLGTPETATVTSEELKTLIANVEPSFAQTHRASANLLDQRI